jgi:hypothetical protein
VNDEARIRRLIPEVIDAIELDLDGLVVFTEAASGPYLWTPLLAAVAGARHVYALAADNAHHTAAQAADATRAAAERFGIHVEVVFEKRPEHLARTDVITNSASLRPITAHEIAALPETAALPLMWETWEFRPGDLDLAACRERGILVLGTWETRPPCDLVPYMGPLAVRLLLDLGLEVHKTSVIVLGGQAMGHEMARYLAAIGCEVDHFATYEALTAEAAVGRDAVIVAEHADPRLLLGPGGAVEPAALAAANPALRIGVVSGTVDGEALRAAGLAVVPEVLRGAGHMHYDASRLGPRPVLELFAAGLRVGAVATRARRAGMGVREAAAHTLRHAPAMDFEGADAWC